MVDDPANAPDGTSTITVKTDDGSYEASFTVTAQCPGVQQIVLGQTLSDPILAGRTLQMTYKTVPEDAYVQTVQWSSADESVAHGRRQRTGDSQSRFRIRPGQLRGDPKSLSRPPPTTPAPPQGRANFARINMYPPRASW